MLATLLTKSLKAQFFWAKEALYVLTSLGIFKHKCKIIGQDFDEYSNEAQFKIGRRGSNKLVTLTAKHFALNHALLKQLTEEDAYMIGFTFASELAAKEKEFMLALKAKKICPQKN